ncbi:MAG TPA: YybS family protein [Firmicutes bacterium]|nr:YybS family protein [Bacillota bacterium]
MPHYGSTRSLVEAALLAALTVVFCLATIYLPVLGLVTGFFWPVPIVLLGVRHDLRLAVLATLVAGLLVAMLAGPLTALSMFLGLGILGLVLGSSMRRRVPPLRAVALGGITLLGSLLLLFAFSLLVMGVNPFQTYLALYQDSVGGVLSFYRSLGVSGENLAQMEKMLEQTLTMMRYLIPMALVVGSGFLSFVNFLLARAVLRRLGVAYPGFPPFATWRFPRSLAYGYIAGIAALVAGQYWKQEVFTHIGLNLQAIFQLLLLMEGLAVAWHFFEQGRVATPLRVLLVALALFTPLVGQLLFLLGLFDLFFDFRHLTA